jgi:hypothetical protein
VSAKGQWKKLKPLNCTMDTRYLLLLSPQHRPLDSRASTLWSAAFSWSVAQRIA